MPSVNCFRRVLLNVGGKKIIISVPNGMTETEVNKVMVVTRAYLQQYVYVEMVLAECFMQKIEKSILKKKCVRFEVKKKWTARRTFERWLSIMTLMFLMQILMKNSQ